MSPEKLKRQIRRHNAIQLAAGALGLLAALLLWWCSYWIFRWATYLWIYLLRSVEIVDARFDGWELSSYIAFGCILILAIEGLRRAKPVFSLTEFHESGYFGAPIHDPLTAIWSPSFAHAWMLTQFLFSAPRVTMVAIVALRSIIRADKAAVEQATWLFDELERNRRWMSPAAFGDCAPSLRLLLQLHLIWAETRNDEFRIRFPAGVGKQEFDG